MTTKVRCSALSSYADCCRRGAAKLYRNIVLDAGYKVREERQNIGAATGTATHAGGEYYLRCKMNGIIPNSLDAEQRSLEALSTEIQNGVIWDDTSPNINTAQKQVLRQVKAYNNFIVPEVTPVDVEEYYEFPLNDRIVLTGHIDVRTIAGIRDTKTGVQSRANNPQYGGYSLLARTAGHDVKTITEDYVPRVDIRKSQPKPIAREFDPANCEMAAYRIAQRMADDIQRFEESGDPWEFLPNPMSMLCSEKFCPAHNTTFCTAHKGD